MPDLIPADVDLPGAVIGFRQNGQPIRLIAGGAPDDDTAPDAGPTPPAPEPPVVEPPAPDPGRPDPRKVEDLPNWAQKVIRDARNEAADYRTKLKEAQVAADEATKAQGPSADEIAEQTRKDFAQHLAKQLGLVEEDKPVDPKVLIDQLTTEKEQTAKERDAERNLHRRAQVELAITRASGRLGADPEALLDSRSFLRNVQDLEPTSDDFPAVITDVIAKAVADNPKFKASSLTGPPAKSGGEFTGGPGGRASDPEQMTIDDFRAQRRRKSDS